MKNLKKVLSLVLALAMALSLMTAAFAADASDYKGLFQSHLQRGGRCCDCCRHFQWRRRQ